MQAIVARLINCCWFVFKWGTVLALMVAALWAFNFYRRFDDEVRRHVETRLGRLYPGLRIAVHSATLIKGEGIKLTGLSILRARGGRPARELYSVEECFLQCKTDWSDLLAGEPDVTLATVVRPTLRATRRPNGTWSAAKLLPLPHLGKRSPVVQIKDGTIEIFDPLRSPSSTLLLGHVNATLTPLAEKGAADGVLRPAEAGGELQRRLLSARGHCGRGRSPPRYFHCGRIGAGAGDFAPSCRLRSPARRRSGSRQCGAVRGKGELNFHVAYDPAAPNPLEFAVRGRVKGGRIDDPRLPHPLTDIRAAVRLDNQGFAVEDLVGRSNQATLRLSASGSLPGEGARLALTATIRHLELDPELVAALPADLQEQWYGYRPLGQIDADVKLQCDGRAWRPDLTLRSDYLSFTHHKFPYRLEHGRGTVSLRDDAIDLHLAAYSGNQQIRIDGQLHGALSDPVGAIDIKGEDLPLDAKLFDAMPEQARHRRPLSRSPRHDQLVS